MAKNIVFCADGTWNGPDDATGQAAGDNDDTTGELTGADLTNVAKLFNKLSGAPTPDMPNKPKEAEKLYAEGGATVQVAKYLHGVGDSGNTAMKVLGGVFGVGVIARIVRGYTFISRHYQPGDAIFITGFSRGAYTARALAGMIARAGLLDRSRYDVNDKEKAYRLGLAAWNRSKGLTVGGNSWFSRLTNRVVDFFETSIGKLTLKDRDLVPIVPIKTVGVWDTVGSMGVPLYLKDKRMDVFRFTDTVLSDRVERGFHAMAIDELRADFPVTPWNTRAGIDQVWFIGAHADVGGGYALDESALSDIALAWMMNNLAGVGIRFAGEVDATKASILQAIHTPWTKPPFKLLAKSQRHPAPSDTFHSSVVWRWKQDASYRPGALAFLNTQNVDQIKIAD